MIKTATALVHIYIWGIRLYYECEAQRREIFVKKKGVTREKEEKVEKIV
jgi:hypothetical protein